MNKQRLLIVEDDQNLGQVLQEFLEMKGFKAQLFRDGMQGLDAFENQNFDLCLLDIMMPKKDGFTLASEIRRIDPSVPIIFLTAKNMTEDVIKGLKLGADDYITKPFSMEELILRIQAILRRSQLEFQHMPDQVYNFGSFEFDYQMRTLTISGSTQPLTSKESDLLRLLCINKNRTLSRNLALKEIWGDDSYFNARSMDVYIAKLRKLIKQDLSVSIMTDHGQGFRLLEVSE